MRPMRIKLTCMRSSEFCQLYCDPTCCFSKASIVKQCNWDFPNVYDYNSTSLNIQPLFWYAVSDDSVGVYAKEKMDLKMMRGQLVLEDYTFALRTLGSFNWAAERENALIAHNVIGLRRRADGSSFVEDLHKSGLISTPVLSICPSSHYGFLRMHFGGLCTDCLKEEHHFVPLVEGTLEYMVDVRSAVVFDYEVHRKHRMMFSESNILYVPHDLLMYLLEENILKNHRFTEYRFLKKIPFKFQWKMTDAFSIDLNTSTVINVLPYFWSVEIETLQPNPDDVRWILSNGLFSEYGLALDYGEKRIGFARRKRDIEC
ncbi:unnamed protein product [Bursaphelenchus xylophilus]|uniref:(pine wood nematode) hypothetical protein n=1 Tax=Bursaphelenchus xylophilus TaxID=6326 RepID=A0A7I8XEK1_BURXY|nr:unnamed protein product [Bursaphelenchus xylophilus]CAG9080502.1 unnamed protein product [Bursaphelenchus xylophilus]